ncbi:MAG: hypothetical protein Q8O88_03495 [bacterium]|nr:hypothetical protein [bacterium]
MSLKKQGKNHPKFKGWYVVNGVKYGSAPEAERVTGIKLHNIIRWCKKGTNGQNFTFEQI